MIEKKTDLISIIVPIYNVEKYLRQCIESILMQTYKELQIILVDDGSNDNSGIICDEFALTDKRIIVLHQENKGLVSARKEGLKLAKGLFIGFVDGDDYIDPNMYEELHTIIIREKVDFVQAGYICNDKEIFRYTQSKIDFNEVDRAEFIKIHILQNQTIPFCIWSKFFRADIIRKSYLKVPDEQSYGEDLLCLCNCIMACKSIYMYKKAFYHYRTIEGSMAHQSWDKVTIEESFLYKCLIEVLKRNHIDDICSESALINYRHTVLNTILEDKSNYIFGLAYRFPDIAMIQNRRVVLYGAGAVGKCYYMQFFKCQECEIVAWIDKDKNKEGLIPIGKPESLKYLEYDVLIIAVKQEMTAKEIKEELQRNKYCDIGNSIIWRNPITLW